MPSREDHPDNLRSIAIIGGGSAGWMAAAALANAVGTNIAITLVESDEIGTVGVGEATIPPIKSFNAGLGIDEKEFVRATQASFKLGIDFVGWGTAESRYFHPFGTYGADFDRVGLHHYWLRERLRGDATPFDDYTMGWALARDNRFGPPVENERDVRSTHAYAYHFDAGLYARFLRRYAEARGVARHEGKVVDVARDPLTGNIAHVRLADGREVAADFFVDCSGFVGLLIERTLEVGHEDWTHWLPCDRALAMPSANTHPLTPYTRVAAHQAGWQWRIPLQHRQGNGHVYSSRHISDDEAAAVLRANLGAEALDEPRLLKFGAGRRKRAWSHNCVSLGLAAGFMEPLESTSLHLIQMGIERLLRLLPTRNHDPLNAEEFNRATVNEWERIRDFLILHYHANARSEPFWRECAAMPIPDELAYKLRHFKAQARLVSPDDELFRNPSWLAVYFGQGIIPEDYDRLADARPQVDAPAQLRNLRELMRAAAQTYPLLDDFIARNAAAPQAAPDAMDLGIERIGREQQPVIVIDDFVPDPERLRAAAEALEYQTMGRHYPGLRAEVAAADVEAFLSPVQGLIAETFGFNGPAQVVSAGYSIVTTRPTDLTPIQRLPHFDGLEAGRVALLHYLNGPERGGTAFYRHRATGYETISADRYSGYDAALREEVKRDGLPAPAYISGDTPLFERIARFEAKANRALIYRGHTLHCADLPADLDFTPDPRTARLTVNTFLFGRA